MKIIQIVFAIVITTFVSVSHATVIFITEKDDNGDVISLLGADNVNVNGSFYNVRFKDGTCVALFNGCDDAGDFVFNTQTDAVAASAALLEKVFVDGVDGEFDNVPNLTNGCVDLRACGVYTPWGFVGSSDLIELATSFNRDDEIDDRVFSTLRVALVDLDQDTDYTYAVWEAVEVSSPNVAIIMLMGIAGLLVSQRRRKV